MWGVVLFSVHFEIAFLRRLIWSVCPNKIVCAPLFVVKLVLLPVNWKHETEVKVGVNSHDGDTGLA